MVHGEARWRKMMTGLGYIVHTLPSPSVSAVRRARSQRLDLVGRKGRHAHPFDLVLHLTAYATACCADEGADVAHASKNGSTALITAAEKERVWEQKTDQTQK